METTGRIKFIDYLKAACVILVIITHIQWQDKQIPIFDYCINMAVPIFMLLSGYNFAMSAGRTLGQWQGVQKSLALLYAPAPLLKKIERFLQPFLPICMVEILLLSIDGKPIHPLRIFLLGAYGPGSYYVPIMLQLVLVFPLIYIIIRRFPRMGLPLIFIAHLIFETAVVVTSMEKYDYRLLLGRYLFLIGFGCWFYLYPQKRLSTPSLLGMFSIGICYLVLNRLGVDFLLFPYWGPTALPMDFYIIPIVVVLFRLFYKKEIPGRIGGGMERIGQASYHIFLVQMVYYHFKLGGWIFSLPPILQIPFHLTINLTVGLWFYEAKRHLWKCLKPSFMLLLP